MSDLIVNWTHPNGKAHEHSRRSGARGVVKTLGLRVTRDEGWYVSVVDSDGLPYVIGFTPFARKADAEMAKMALEAAGLDSVRAMMEAGPVKVIATMYEGLAW